jgi:nucleoside-diphosphate-sugar epimerase
MQNEAIIIGNGLIARSLTGIDFGRSTLILASGVSDSQEKRVEAFQRETDLVEQLLDRHQGLHVLYCSTCSVESGALTPYTAHKLAIEQRIVEKAKSCHVFRLPQVVGVVQNRTLVSHFVGAILDGKEMTVQARATRNLLDVRDFTRVVELIVRRNVGVGVPQNIASSTQVPVADIVEEIARLLRRAARSELVDSGYSQTIDSRFLHELLPDDDPLFDPGYWRRVLQHYVPLMAANLAQAKAAA